MRKCGLNILALFVFMCLATSSAWATSIDIQVSTPTTSTSPIVAGSNIIYSFTAINNTGTPAPAGTVQVTINMPTATSGAVGGYVSLTAPANWTFTTPAQGSQAQIIVTNTGIALSNGAPQTFTLTAKIASSGTGTVSQSNSIAHTAGGGNTDPTPANNSATSAALTLTFNSDIAVVFTSSPSTIVAGGTRNCVYTITNNGPSDAQTINVTHSKPAGLASFNLSFTSGVSGGSISNATSTSVASTFTFAVLAAGAFGQYTSTEGIAGGTPFGTTFTDTVSETSATADSNSGNNSAPSTATSALSIDLTLSSPATVTTPIVAGLNIVYTFSAINNSAGVPAPANTVQMIVNMPTTTGTVTTAGFVSLTPPAGWTFTDPGVGSTAAITVTNTSAPLVNGANQLFTLTSKIAPSGTGTISNTETIQHSPASGSTDPSSNNTATSSAPFPPVSTSADVVVAFTTSPTTVVPGGSRTCVYTITNNGPSDAQTVNVTHAKPAGLATFSLTNTGGTAPGPITNFNDPTLTSTFTIATLAAGASSTYTLNEGIAPGASPGSQFTETVTATSATTDPATPNSATSTATVTGAFDLAVTKPVTATTPIVAGAVVAYTFSAQNNSAIATPQNTVDVTVNMPTNSSFSSMTPPVGWTFTSLPVAGATTPVVLRNSTAALATGAPVLFTLNAKVNPSAASGLTLTESVSIAFNPPASNVDPVPSNDTMTSDPSSGITTVADMRITVSGSDYFAGTSRTVTFLLKNNGPSDSPGNNLFQMPLPGNGIVVTNPVFVGGTVAPNASYANNGSNNSVQFEFPTFPPDGTSTVTITETAPANLTTPLSYTDTATFFHNFQSPSVTDPDSSNDKSSLPTTVTASADISVTYSSTTGTLAGANRTLNITVTNVSGPSDATQVVLTQNAAAGASTVSFDPAGATVANKTGPNTFTIPTLAIGATATFTFVEAIDPATSGVLNDSATVSSAASDPAAVNNTAAASALIAQNADLEMTMVTKTAAPAPAGFVGIGDLVTYTITLVNHGPSAASNVVVTSLFPPNTTFDSASGDADFAGALPGGKVTFSAPSFAPLDTAVFDITSKVNQGIAEGLFVVQSPTVTTTSNNTPGHPAPTSSLTTKKITDLVVKVVSATPASPIVGSDVVYTITFANNGPTDTPSVVFTTQTPADTTFKSFTLSPPSAVIVTTPAVGATGTITAASAMLASQVLTFTLTVNVNTTITATTLTETASASITPAGPDPNTANDSSTLVSTVNFPIPTMAIDDVKVIEGNSSDPASPVFALFTVTLTGLHFSPVTVDFATADGTTATAATAPTQYTATSGKLTFTAADATQTIKVPIVQDTISESDMTFTVKLTNPVNSTLTKAVGTGTILNDDLGGAIQFSLVEYQVNQNAGTADITLIRTGGDASGVTVDFATSDVTAIAGADYTSAAGTVKFDAKQTKATISVPLLNKPNATPSAKFEINLSKPTGGATLGTLAKATVTILAAPKLTSAPSASGQIGAAFTYLLSATGELPLTITVQDLTTLPPGLFISGGYITGTPTQAGSFTVSIAAQNVVGIDTKTVTINILPIPPVSGAPNTATDSDGDGFPDELEAVAKTDPLNAKATPIGNQAAKPLPILNGKLAITLNFGKANGDSISMTGIVALPNGMPESGKLIYVDVGGVIRKFALDSGAKSKNGPDSLSFKAAGKSNKKGATPIPASAVLFTLKIAKAKLADLLADDGLTSAPAAGAAHTVPVFIMFNNALASVQQPQLYTNKNGKSGKTKTP